VLVGRDVAALERAAKELSALGVESVSTLQLDVLDVARHEEVAREAEELLDGIDLLVVAAGSLGSAELDGLDPDGVARSIGENFTGPAAAITAFAQRMRAQGHGRILVLSSVAGVRVRAANFVYGAGKAGLDGFSQGLGDALAGSGVRVVIVRPGFVRTKMTAGLPAAPLAVDADEVAAAIVTGLERNAAVIWVPGVLRYLFAVMRLLPQQIWRRLPG
jgi:decaprenylphospho-beta-D-erythro-pentofuranosid-2-ulose 2-reductase